MIHIEFSTWVHREFMLIITIYMSHLQSYSQSIEFFYSLSLVTSSLLHEIYLFSVSVCLSVSLFVCFLIHFFQLSENHTEVQWLWMPQWRRGVLCMRVSDKIELTTTTNASVRAHTHTPDTHRPERARA